MTFTLGTPNSSWEVRVPVAEKSGTLKVSHNRLVTITLLHHVSLDSSSLLSFFDFVAVMFVSSMGPCPKHG